MKLVALSLAIAACGPKPTPVAQPPIGAATPDAAEASITRPDAATAEVPDGSWSVDAVMPTVQAKYMKPIKRCYKEALKIDPTLTGKVSIDLTIGVDGKVTSAKASGIGPAVDDCITHEAKTWVFPKPPDVQMIRFTLVMLAD